VVTRGRGGAEARLIEKIKLVKLSTTGSGKDLVVYGRTWAFRHPPYSYLIGSRIYLAVSECKVSISTPPTRI